MPQRFPAACAGGVSPAPDLWGEERSGAPRVSRSSGTPTAIWPVFRRSKAAIRGGKPTKRPSSMLKRLWHSTSKRSINSANRSRKSEVKNNQSPSGRKPRRPDDRVERLENMMRGFRIEIAGWLVGEQYALAVGNRAGNRDALLLAAGQFGRPLMSASGKSQKMQQL